jgi:hypothetical protein
MKLNLIAVLFLSVAAAAQMPTLPSGPTLGNIPSAPQVQQQQAAAQPAQAARPAAAAATPNVYVTFKVLKNGDGDEYGFAYFVNSTYDVPTCAFPYVKRIDNMYGAVTPGPIQLKPNEKNFSIGQFNGIDQSKGWSVLVAAKFHTGSC